MADYGGRDGIPDQKSDGTGVSADHGITGPIHFGSKDRNFLFPVELGHCLFDYIRPYPDGNGRMTRFVMNAMLASGGYLWTVIRVEDRDVYLAALERASID